jgi:hypothetical protein
MDFIFMLTRNDKTILDALEMLHLLRPVGLKHIGFKDVGVAPATLRQLSDEIRAMGAESYLEVVSTSPEDTLNSVRVAVEIGVDHLLGGTRVEEILAITRGTPTRYYPFPGRPFSHPTKLGGTAAEVEADCRRFIDLGCGGVDLLAYRATDSDPVDLIRAARKGLGDNRLIIAGGIDSAPRIKAVQDAGADAFTIGTAIFNGGYRDNLGSPLSQLKAVFDDLDSAATTSTAVASAKSV